MFPRISYNELVKETSNFVDKSINNSHSSKKQVQEKVSNPAKMPIVPPKLVHTLNYMPDITETPQWYCVLSPREKRGVAGPFSEAALKKMYKSNEIGDGTLMWRDGEAEWQQLIHHSFLRSKLITMPIIPPKAGNYNAELAVFDPDIEVPPVTLTKHALPLHNQGISKACSQCGGVAAVHIPNFGEPPIDLFQCRSEVGTDEYTSEIIPGLLWVGNSGASKYRSIHTLGFTLLINCTDNVQGPLNKAPFFRVKDCPLPEEPKEMFSPKQQMDILSKLELVFDWIEYERLTSDKNTLSDKPPPKYRGAVDEFGFPVRNAENKPFRRPDPDATTPVFPPHILLWSRLGKDRSCMVAVSYLIKRYGTTLPRAIDIVSGNCQDMNISNHYLDVLEYWSMKYTLGTFLCIDCKYVSDQLAEKEEAVREKRGMRSSMEFKLHTPKAKGDKAISNNNHGNSIRASFSNTNTNTDTILEDDEEEFDDNSSIGSLEEDNRVLLPSQMIAKKIHKVSKAMKVEENEDNNLLAVKAYEDFPDYFKQFKRQFTVLYQKFNIQTKGKGDHGNDDIIYSSSGRGGMVVVGGEKTALQEEQEKLIKFLDNYLRPIKQTYFETSSWTKLIKLSLNDLKLADGIVAAIIAAMGKVNHSVFQLYELSLRNNNIDEKTWKELLFSMYARQHWEMEMDEEMDQFLSVPISPELSNRVPEMIIFDVSHNKIGKQGAYYLSLFLRLTPSIIHCNLSHCEMSDISMSDILTAITTPLPPFIDNDEPTMYGANSGMSGRFHAHNYEDDVLSTYYNQSITDLNISHHKFGKHSFAALNTYLKRSDTLYSIHLDVCSGIAPKQMKSLMSSIKLYGHRLGKLSMQDFQNLSVKSMEYIALIPKQKIPANVHYLMEINLSTCRLKPLHMKSFCLTIAFAKHLRKLHFGHNPLGDEGMAYFCDMLLSSSPYYLMRLEDEAKYAIAKSRSVLQYGSDDDEEQDLAECTGLTNPSHDSYRKGRLVVPPNPFALTSAEEEKLSLPSLQYLDLSGCSILAEGCALLLETLIKRKCLLSYLDLSYNTIGEPKQNPRFYELFPQAGIASGYFNYCSIQSNGMIQLAQYLSPKPIPSSSSKTTTKEAAMAAATVHSGVVNTTIFGVPNVKIHAVDTKNHAGYTIPDYGGSDNVSVSSNMSMGSESILGAAKSQSLHSLSLATADYLTSQSTVSLPPNTRATRLLASAAATSIPSTPHTPGQGLGTSNMPPFSPQGAAGIGLGGLVLEGDDGSVGMFSTTSSQQPNLPTSNKQPNTNTVFPVFPPNHAQTSRCFHAFRCLGLAGNGINDSAAKAIGHLIRTNELLEVLDLGFNELTSRCAKIFADSITVTSGSSTKRKLQELHVNLVGNQCDPYLLNTPGMARSKINFRFGIQPNPDDELCHGYAHIANEARGKVLVQKELQEKYHQYAPPYAINGLR